MPDIRATNVILDDFNRPDEDPLSGGGNWAQMAPGAGRDPMRLHNNSASSHEPATTGIEYSYWTPTIFPEGDIEIWSGPRGGEAGAALSGWRFGFMVASTIPSANYSGYLFLRESALGDFIYFRRYTNGSFVDIPGPVFTEDYGPLLLARRIGNTLEAWCCTTNDGTGTWTLITTIDDATYNGPWRLFLGIEDPTGVGTGWDYFGGGMQSVVQRQQIYRIIHAPA